MARFDLSQYETVEARLRRFHETHEDGRIVTDCVVAGVDGMWLFRASVYLNAADQAAGLPKATGYASEREGGPQTEWKAELGETSAIGRALANMNLSASKRASREEMEKVARHEQAQVKRNWVAEAEALTDVDALRLLWAEASQAGATSSQLQKVKARAEQLGVDGKSKGAR